MLKFQVFTSFALLASCVVGSDAEVNRQLQANGAAALQNAAAETQAFVNSLVELMATDKLSQPTLNSFPEYTAVKEVEDKKNTAILDYFIDEQILPKVTPLFDEINGQANCELWTYDSVEYNIAILALAPLFTIRDVVGVVAGFCLEASNTFARGSYTVRKDTAKDYDISLNVDQSLVLEQRSLLTSGEVFISGVANADPASFVGSFEWRIVADGWWPVLDFDLEKQVPVTGWGPVTRTCLTAAPMADGANISTRVENCQATNLSIVAGGVDICLTDPTTCESFSQQFCLAVTDEVVLPFYYTNSATMTQLVADELPVCVDTH